MTKSILLGIETTCDETGAAVFTAEPRILSSIVSSQTDLHAQFGGVVPEIASRAHLTTLLPVVRKALARADVDFPSLEAVAVANTPGLVGAILVGLSAAKAISLALDIPLIGYNHLTAHIYSCQMTREESIYPCVGLVVSGGHSNLFLCRSPDQMELVGSTTDDAAGEAFDKVASLLKLGYPGGPAIEEAARGGEPNAFDFPRTFLGEERLDFSFSGLKTAVRYALYGQNAKDLSAELDPKTVADAAASFQQAVIDVLVAKCDQALKRFGMNRLCVGGGVAANTALRSALTDLARRKGFDFVVPPLEWCTDNAAMAAVAVHKYRRGEFDPLDLDAVPGLVRRS